MGNKTIIQTRKTSIMSMLVQVFVGTGIIALINVLVFGAFISAFGFFISDLREEAFEFILELCRLLLLPFFITPIYIPILWWGQKCMMQFRWEVDGEGITQFKNNQLEEQLTWGSIKFFRISNGNIWINTGGHFSSASIYWINKADREQFRIIAAAKNIEQK